MFKNNQKLLIELLCKELKLTPDKLSPDMGLRTIKGWTSLTHVDLILKIEKLFKVSFSNSEIVKLNTIEKILNSISERKK